MDLAALDQQMLKTPSELSGPLPRKVQMSDGDARHLLVIVLLFFVGGSIILGWSLYNGFTNFQRRAVLRSDGREVVGEVTGFSYPRYAPMSVVYRFTVDGRDYSSLATEPATPGPGTSFDKGDKIPIRFLPSDPAINHPSAWEWSPAIGWYFTAGEIFFWIIGGWAFAVLRRDRQLARDGKAAAAIVIGCTRDDRWFRVDYEFRAENGASVKGHNDFKEEYGVGARIWVLYLPHKPQRNHIYPLSFYTVVA
jgi:hypothetical protein